MERRGAATAGLETAKDGGSGPSDIRDRTSAEGSPGGALTSSHNLDVWEWRGNQLYSPPAQMTILRDVTFWNCSRADKALIETGPELLRHLKQACRQWEMYADMVERDSEGRWNLKDEASPEGDMYRAALAVIAKVEGRDAEKSQKGC